LNLIAEVEDLDDACACAAANDSSESAYRKRLRGLWLLARGDHAAWDALRVSNDYTLELWLRVVDFTLTVAEEVAAAEEPPADAQDALSDNTPP
jgi:hypothetical protein